MRPLLAPVPDAETFHQLDQGAVQGVEDPISGFDSVLGDVIPDIVDILLPRAARGRIASPLGALPLGAAAADLSKGLFTVNELSTVGLFAGDGDLLAQCRQSQLLPLLAFVEKSQFFVATIDFHT